MAPVLVGQDQHAAPGSHSLDSSAQASNSPPILRSINPTHDLERYQTFCSVESVYYYPDGEHTRAAVVLEVGFILPSGLGERFIYAMLPTCAPDTQLNRIPEQDEVVNMSEYNTTDAHTLSPNVQGAGVGISLGSVSHQVVRTSYGLLRLLSQKPSHDKIRWEFVNNKSNCFPSCVRLLLLVKGSGSPRFPFNLKILSTLKVHIQTKSWHRWTTKFQPEDGDGWSFQIQNDYYPEKAKNFLHEHQKPRAERNASQLVGMRAAVISYLEEVRR